ncbi:MAG: hypothetical protein F4179_10920, partial [Gammaproteobacteria bacterium]|nr:hypothetical protein [Gammaproteobacteria bacterium]
MNWRRPGGLSRAVCLPALAALLAGFSGSVPAVAQTPVPEMRATATPDPRPPTLDGVLDEPVYETVPPITG